MAANSKALRTNTRIPLSKSESRVSEVRPADAQLGTRLVGWLVSYENDLRGESHEIRSGRSFISSAALPDNRNLVLEVEDISNPHIAFNASEQHRVMVQDVFSDSGTFLVRGGSGQELVVRGPTEVQHGDWLRIGSKTKFQVCLIDQIMI